MKWGIRMADWKTFLSAWNRGKRKEGKEYSSGIGSGVGPQGLGVDREAASGADRTIRRGSRSSFSRSTG